MSNVKDETTLKKSYNRVTITGTVLENNLVVTKDNNDLEIIKGDLIVRVGEDNEHKLKCYSKKFTTKGKENPSYKSLIHAASYVSVASVMEGHSPTRLHLKSGELRMNTYLNGKGDISEYPEIFASFLETAKGDQEDEATFDVEGVLESLAPEFKDDVETGRYKAKIILFDYNGRALPFNFLTTPDAGSYMSVNYAPNGTSRVWGNLISSVDKTTVVLDGFGATKKDVTSIPVRELVINGGESAQKQEGIGYDVEKVKKALAEREIMIEELKTNGNSKPANSSFSSPKAATTTTAPKW